MIFPRFATLAVAATLTALPGIALAADNKLVLVIGGEAYDGPPKFTVTYDGKPLGDGVVKSAIDTVTAGRFSDAADKKPYVQNFDFTIPEAEFKPNAEIAVKFTNEAFGGPGSSHDRNLYVQSVAVNGDVVPAAKLATRTKDGAAPNIMVGDYLELKDGAADAVAKAPEGGWPATAEAAVAPKPAPVVSEVAANAPPLQPAVKPATIETAQAETPKTDATEPAKPPEAAPKPEPAPPVKPAPAPAEQAAAPDAKTEGCTIDKSFAIVGFNENSNELTPKLNKQLDDVAK
ncbi:MAG TPA: carbohydrate-binding domain-containing protein, partial [Arsenicitalea sp.]|nr:carbohydrate-binding domain-containing protein [Arsenicitalea sp.]